MKIHTISELKEIAGKYVLLRDDFNVQIVDGKITDTFRIKQSLPTIRALRDAGARIAILAHLGRPDGVADPKLSLAPVAAALSELLGEPVPLIADCIGDAVAAARTRMKNGDIILLENIRFHAAEEKNDPEFSKQLAAGFDIYVNDAFAVSHRAHASTVGVTKILPSYAGSLLATEVAEISKMMENPKRPLMGIIAGSKISTKIGVLKSLVKICDTIAVGGGIGNTFKFALGDKIGNSIHEPSMAATALEIMDLASTHGCRIMTSIDKGTAKNFASDAVRTDKTFDQIEPDDMIMDEGPQSVKEYMDAIDESQTVIMNGPLGVAEWQPTWSRGTFAVIKHIAERTRAGKVESILGGGDAVAALEATGTQKDITYVSTGGGAFLEFIEFHTLPGVAALEVK